VAEGTTCDSGRICINNKCVRSILAPINSCVFNDQLIFQSHFGDRLRLPYSPMNCESYLEYAYKNLAYDDFSGCLNPFVKENCCKACRSKHLNI
jgi:hypothetical protein